MAGRARAKYIRVPPRKARLVADLVRGKNAGDAASLLRFVPRQGALAIGKLLKSAVSNASVAGKVDPDNLYIREIMVDAGPVLKRFQPRAHARATARFHRTSHITMVLGER